MDSTLIHVVDDEPDVRDALRLLLHSLGYQVRTYASAQEFLDTYQAAATGCLVLDVRLPGMNGMELQRQLKALGIAIPIVFISGHGDIPMAVRAVQAGAVDFLEKPFNDQDLLDRVERALSVAREQLARAETQAEVEREMAALTPREQEVMERLLEGKPNKVIARELDVSVRTVEIHRARVLQKMEVDNVPQLVRKVLSS